MSPAFNAWLRLPPDSPTTTTALMAAPIRRTSVLRVLNMTFRFGIFFWIDINGRRLS